MAEWTADLEAARERLAALDERRDLESATAAAHEWRWADRFSGFFLPLPPVAQTIYNAYGDWRESEDERGGGADALALDAHGRPVAHVLDRGSEFERAKHLWWWEDEGSFFEIELMGSGPYVRRARAVDGRIAYVATASDWGRDEVSVLTWRDGHAVRADVASVSTHGGSLHARAAEYDADGRLARMRHTRESEPGSGDLAADLTRAAALEPDQLGWDGRVRAPEPWPGTEAAMRRAAPLADALAAALRAAVAEADVLDPFMVQVYAAGDRDTPFPPKAEVLPAAWRDRMRRSSGQDGAALHESYKAREAGVTVDLAIVDRLDEEALRTCRMLTTAMRTGSPWSRAAEADPVAEAVGARLAQRLNAEPIPGTADPFLALVYLGARYNDDRRRHTVAAVGEERYAAFMASLSSTKPRGGAARKAKQQARAALEDRVALEAFLREGGLEGHAARVAHEIAEVGLLLEPAEGVSSRLGGPPLLPEGEPWPEGLTFVAAIDLAELPPNRLPDHGWMLAFIHLGTGDADGLIDEADNAPGSVARLFWTESPVSADGPALRERRVRARPVLALPDTWSAGEALALDVYERQTYEELEQRLSEAVSGNYDRHWIGGHATGAQGYDMQPGTLILLSITSDEALDFEFLDGGTAQFRIPPDALAARDFTQVTAVADSC